MSALTENLLRNGSGSIGETARAYADLYKKINALRTLNEDEFNNALLNVLTLRAIVYENLGVHDGNLLIPIHLNGLKQIHVFFKEVEEYIKTRMPIPNYVDKSIELRLDLPTMILYSMVLESDNKRKGFAGAGELFIKRVLKVVHQEVKSICPYQVLFSEEDFIEENYGKILVFIQDADSSLGDLIRMSNSN